MVWLSRSGWGQYCVSCVRGNSTALVEMWIEAWSEADARARLTQLGYTPIN